jgi:hypothetical protein
MLPVSHADERRCADPVRLRRPESKLYAEEKPPMTALPDCAPTATLPPLRGGIAIAWLRRAAALFALALFAAMAVAGPAAAQSTAFVYQGRLEDPALTPANGAYDLRFTLFDEADSEVGEIAVEGVDVRQGLFSVTLDFGALAFAGTERELEIAVKKPEDASYTTLTPRQPIRSAPYAIRAQQAGLADSAVQAADANLLGGIAASGYLRVDGSGANLTNLHAGSLASGTVPDARLPANLARTSGSQTFTGNQTIAGNLAVTGALSANTLSATSLVVRIFQVNQLASVAWTIDTPADYHGNNNQNPTLVLQRGLTYQFAVSTPGHPFRLASSNGGPAYNVGVSNNDVQTGVLTFKVPMDAPATLFYYCLVHPGMNGIITIQ